MTEVLKEKEMTLESAILQIDILLSQMHQEGGVDSERDQVDGILKKLKEGTLTPEEAVRSVHQLNNQRQSYH